MAQRTHTEVIQELRNNVTVLRAELHVAATELERAKLLRVRERWKLVEQQIVRLDKKATESGQQHKQIAVLEDRANDLRWAREEAEKHYGQFVVPFVGGLITLGINLAVSFVRKVSGTR